MNTLIMHATCRKDYVRREDGVATRWDNTWGFLIGEYETVSLGNMVCLQAGSYLLGQLQLPVRERNGSSLID